MYKTPETSDHPLAASVAEHRFAHRMPFGAELRPDGSVRFRLWAPGETKVQLLLGGSERLEMRIAENGWHELITPRAQAGARYQFEVSGGLLVPDPASRYQPDDCHGPSEVVDPFAYRWRHADWRGRPWHEAVIYELHVGTFTPEGTFAAAAEKLDDLVELGVTAIEIMPVADFPGRRNWGYDGVLFYAPDSAYGRPEDLKALVDAAHARGLMVLLDVVYNHFGPDGNYFGAYAPPLFTDRHQTPWGAAVNYDGRGSRPVRDFIIHNALYWLEEFRLDGLRLDAVHAIHDESGEHVLEELAHRVRASFPGRHIHLVLENEENEARRLERGPDGTPKTFTAQWNDDVHHALHTAVTGEGEGYYVEYLGDAEKLGRALAEGFAFQGQMMAYRGHARGEPSAYLPPTCFIAFLQNHDQIGNRAFGERITALAEPAAVRAAASVYLLLPQVPMLFMGEEWAASQPFVFFCDFGPELSKAVRRGRREEFGRFPEFQSPEQRARIPDPTSEQTFASAKLNWSARQSAPHAEWLDWYKRILAVRRKEIVPRLAGMTGSHADYRTLGLGAVAVNWTLGDRSRLSLLANLAGESAAGIELPKGDVLWTEGSVSPDGTLAPWTVQWVLAG